MANNVSIQTLESALREGGLSRRKLLQAALLTLSAAPIGAYAKARPRFIADPFTLGVASGYPTPSGFTLWSRLAPAPLDLHGGMEPEWVYTQIEVAEDETFKKIVRSERYKCTPDMGHSMHLDVTGLQPDRGYYYRFSVADARSPTGYTRTAARADQARRTRFAVASCQHYEQGYFNAYDHMLADEPDLVFFVGDYIYESSWGDDRVRRHIELDPRSVEQYRRVHSQYRLDAALQRIQARIPWVYTWDDHEVQNDYAGLEAETRDPAFWLRRAAAYQAFYEHTPLPLRMRPQRDEMRIYDSFAHASTARFFVLDCRQYRDPIACQPAQGGGGSADPLACAELSTDRSMLGQRQEQWLDSALKASTATWNVLVQTTLFARADEQAGEGERYSTDGWSGYPRAQDRLIAALASAGANNPLIVGGDVHAFYAADVTGGTRDSAPVATEFVCSSISAQGNQMRVDAQVRNNPHMHFGRGDARGYLLVDLCEQGGAARMRQISSEKSPISTVNDVAKFALRPGKPGVYAG